MEISLNLIITFTAKVIDKMLSIFGLSMEFFKNNLKTEAVYVFEIPGPFLSAINI